MADPDYPFDFGRVGIRPVTDDAPIVLLGGERVGDGKQQATGGKRKMAAASVPFG